MPDDLPVAPELSVAANGIEDRSSFATRMDASNFLWLSLWIPGAGQVAQRRFGAAAVQAATIVTYLIAAASAGGDRALWLALAWYAWSAIDAYWHARNS